MVYISIFYMEDTLRTAGNCTLTRQLLGKFDSCNAINNREVLFFQGGFHYIIIAVYLRGCPLDWDFPSM